MIALTSIWPSVVKEKKSPVDRNLRKNDKLLPSSNQNS